MSSDENKDLVRRYIEAVDANQSSDWSILDQFIADDFIAHNPAIPGVSLDRDGMKQAAEIFRVAAPGRHEIPMQVASSIAAPASSSVFGKRSRMSCVIGRLVMYERPRSLRRRRLFSAQRPVSDTDASPLLPCDGARASGRERLRRRRARGGVA